VRAERYAQALQLRAHPADVALHALFVEQQGRRFELGEGKVWHRKKRVAAARR